MGYRGFLDANVLVPARPRDVLLTLGHAGLYTPLWSDTVLDEVRRHLPQRMAQDARDHLFRTMAEAFPEARTDAPERIDITVRGVVNAKDEHVLAAALWAHADVIVTEDLDLAREAAGLIDVQPVDLFLAYTVDVDVACAVSALITMARRRWLPSTEQAHDAEVVARLLRWSRCQGWEATHDILAKASDSYLGRRDLDARPSA
jgi:predicted nucleic acid-binding protein